MNRSVCFAVSVKPSAVIGSPDSYMIRCFGFLAVASSPLINRTLPFANPIAIWERFFRIAIAEAYIISFLTSCRVPETVESRV